LLKTTRPKALGPPPVAATEVAARLAVIVKAD